MKSFNIFFMFSITAIVLSTGCSKTFEDYSKNNNLPLQVPPSRILPSVLGTMAVSPGGDEDKHSQFIVSNYTYYGLNTYWSGSAGLNYGTLRDVLAMEKEASRLAGSDNNPYHALGLFFRAFYFVNMSQKVGDLPMTEALKGIDNPAPKYDAQKDIFKQSLLWLDTANTMLAGFIKDGFLEYSGDIYYAEKGRENLIKWQKVVNSFKLRLLISLSKHADDADLGVKTEFAKIYGNPELYPLFSNNDDNLKYTYNSTYNFYPDNPENYGNNAGRLNIAATLLNNLSALHDIRAMVFAEPARGLGFADTDFRSFEGGKSGDDMSSLADKSGDSKISLYNYHHYYSTYTAEPTLILSYGEVCYSIAEAMNRGWITGSAKDWYEKGTTAMFDFYSIADGVNQVVFQKAAGGDITYPVSFSYASYFSQPLVAYKGDNADGLKQILLQKYLGFARNSGMQGYYQWRRTGVPVFDIGTGSGNGGKIPLRYQYPSDEGTVNKENLNAALASQYGGSDDINAQMWLIK
jgi:hypothetical protein